MQNKSRQITQNTIKRLYGLSGNVCANPECRKKLIDNLGNQYGEIAHICVASPEGPRYDSTMSDDDRRNIDNLLLLCEDCNKLIDNKDNVKDYPVELLRDWKRQHEKFTSSDAYSLFWKTLDQKLTNFEVRKQEIKENNPRYHSTIQITKNKKSDFVLTGLNILSDYINTLIKQETWETFPDILLEGIGGIGKSTELKIAFNTLIDIFQEINNYDDYQFCPIPYYLELKNFQPIFFNRINIQDNIILFLDGLDELSNSNVVEFQKWLNNLRTQYKNIRFIISGRNAAFSNLSTNFLIQPVIIKLTHAFSEEENKELIQKYKGTKILDVINIPFYRSILEKEDVYGYKDFFDKLFLRSLLNDKERHEYAKNITEWDSNFDLEKVQEKLSLFCHQLFRRNKLSFSVTELKDNLQNYFDYVIKSSLISYKDDETVSFSSNIFFEYFLAIYYEKKTIDVIRKEIFLSSGRLNVRYINVVGILLVLLNKGVKQYTFLTKQLAKESYAFIVLTDFSVFSDEERWDYYLRIYNEFNSKKEIIFYSNFHNKHGVLANIDSLCEAMYHLLPDSKKSQTVSLLSKNIEKYINKPIESEINSFANSVILLGIWWQKIWDIEQQRTIKNIVIPLIKFLLFNPICDKYLHGLISESLVFNWYYIYNWTSDWLLNDWEAFIKSVYPCSGNIYDIYDENDYKIKLELFIKFYTNPVIEKLLTPLAIYILNKQKDDLGGAGFIPDEIDDNYMIPTSHLDGKIFEFNNIVKEMECIPCDDLINIVYSVLQDISAYNNGDYESRTLFNELIKKWKQEINIPTNAGCNKIYEIIKLFINDNKGIYISDFSSNLDYLSDESKETIFGIVISKRNSLKNDIYLFIVISKLLNLSNKEKSLTLFKQLKSSCDANFIKDIVRAIRSHNKNHILYEISEALFNKYFSNEIKQETGRQKNIEKIIDSTEIMLKNEVQLIQSKSLLLAEIDKINSFISAQKNSDEESNRHNIYELSVDCIKNSIKFDYGNSYIIPPVFSDFVIKLMEYYYRNDDYLAAIAKAKECIEYYFSEECLFWEFFFWHYISEYSEEKVFDLLSNNHSLKSKLLNCMEDYVKEKINTLTLENVDNHSDVLRRWLTPFILSLKYFYDGRIPLWFDKDKLSLLTVYSSWNLKLTSGILDTNFPWLEYKSVFEWLENRSDLDINNLIRQSLLYYNKISRAEAKGQLLTYYIENLNELDLFKTDIIELIILETLYEMNQDYTKKESDVINWSVLPRFWNKTNENFINRLINDIPFEKYKKETKNSCLNAIIDYFIRVATKEQKESVIHKLRKQIKEKNIIELLSVLGYEKANIFIINGYLKGAQISSNIYFSRENVLCQSKQSNRLLFWYIRLFFYSLKKMSDRRSSLYSIAQKGIRFNITRKSFKIVKLLLIYKINKRRKKNLYFLGLQDFLDELEQIVLM